jgi:hypothetical protein
MSKDSGRAFIALIASILVLGLLILAVLPAMAQPPCNIKYMVIPYNQLVPGPLVAPGYYNVWYGWSTNNKWTTYGPFTLRGGHKYLIMPDLYERGSSGFWEDHTDLSSYPYPTSDVAAVYYRNWDYNERSYRVTVCP